MGAFNVLRAETTCGTCRRSGVFPVQFKYGDTWQHEFGLGDALSWGGNDVGRQGAGAVKVQGLGGPCPHCGTDYQEFVVVIEHDRIRALRPATSAEYASLEPLGYEIVSP